MDIKVIKATLLFIQLFVLVYDSSTFYWNHFQNFQERIRRKPGWKFYSWIEKAKYCALFAFKIWNVSCWAGTGTTYNAVLFSQKFYYIWNITIANISFKISNKSVLHNIHIIKSEIHFCNLFLFRIYIKIYKKSEGDVKITIKQECALHEYKA